MTTTGGAGGGPTVTGGMGGVVVSSHIVSSHIAVTSQACLSGTTAVGCAFFVGCGQLLGRLLVTTATTGFSFGPVYTATYDPPYELSAQEVRDAAERRVEELMGSLTDGAFPELTEALLYQHLYHRGQRLDGISTRISKLTREKR